MLLLVVCLGLVIKKFLSNADPVKSEPPPWGGCRLAHQFVGSFCWFVLKFCRVSFFVERCCEPQGKNPARQEGFSAPGALEEGGGTNGRDKACGFFVLGENSDGVCGIRDPSKAANKPPPTPNGSNFSSRSSPPEVISSDPCEVRHGVKRVSRRNPWVLPFGSGGMLGFVEE